MNRRTIVSCAVPIVVFGATFAAHAAWITVFPEHDAVQDLWADVGPPAGSWLQRYVDGGSYWMGYSYALSLTLAVVAIRRFLRRRTCAAQRVGIGAMSFTGVLALFGCFLIGCCGSPMLAVWISLLGAGFAPLAKPLVALLTTLSVGIGWAWMVRHDSSAARPSDALAGAGQARDEPCCPTGPQRA